MNDSFFMQIVRLIRSHDILRWVFMAGVVVVIILLMLGVRSIWGLVAWLAAHTGR